MQLRYGSCLRPNINAITTASPIISSPRPLEQSRLNVVAGIAVAVWLVWLVCIGPTEARRLMFEQWAVMVTMMFGSFIAGGSSEGGGAVAFAVFTKALAIQPSDAKLFALAIQSVGMTAASITIFALRIRVHWPALFWATAGGVFGIWLGLRVVSPVASPVSVKIFFTSLQAAFAFALWLRIRKQHVNFRDNSRNNVWPYAATTPWLLVFGFVGGIASGLIGCGIDLIVFAYLVLRCGISESVATPTSVVLMAVNSLVGMTVFMLAESGLPPLVLDMWLSAIPIVVVGAPLGAFVCSRISRDAIRYCLITLISIEVVTTILIVPIPLPTAILAATCTASAAAGLLALSK